jgi:hypothetical protein
MSPRAASNELIPGIAALSVGHPHTTPPEGWQWVRLLDVARLESGHTPSRKHPEYWNGEVPWVSLPDARKHHGRVIHDTTQKTNQEGLANSAARLLPTDTVCLSRTASVGYVFRLGRPMATSQDFVNWVCSDALDPRFLMYALMAEGDHILNFGKGTTHTTIYFPEVLAFYLCLPPMAEQRRIVERIELALVHTDAARDRLARVPVILKRFRQSVLAAACSGELTTEWRPLAGTPMSVTSREGSSGQVRRRAGRLWGAGVVPPLTEEERVSIPESWTWTKVLDLGPNPDETVQIGPMSMKSSQFSDRGVSVLNVGCVQSGWIDASKCDYLPPKIAAQFERYRIRKGDVLFTRSGTVGRCAVAGEEHNGHVITFHLLRLRPEQRLCRSRYLWMALTGAPSIRRQASEAQIGSTRGGFNTRLLASLDVPLPPPVEQDEIARRADELLRLADVVERHVGAVRLRGDKLSQAVLAKAYTGKLVPTEAELARRDGRDYESVSILLERARAPRTTVTPLDDRAKTRRPLRKGAMRGTRVSA